MKQQVQFFYSFMMKCCLCISLLFLVVQLPAQHQSSLKQRPNILFIMADDHTSQAWGIYGGPLKNYVKNNNIKRLAAKGMVLNNTFCTNSICVPSRAAILTGQYSNRNSVYTLGDALSPDSNTIAGILQQNGYQTAIFGKWHLKQMPSGFDTFNLLPGHGVYHNPKFLSRSNWNNQESNGEQINGYTEDLITGMSLDWMKQRDTTRPFFLMCHFKATHEPFEFAERFKDLYNNIEFPYPPTFLDWGAQTTGRSFPGQPLEELGNRYEKASTGKFWTTYPELPFTTKGMDSLTARKKIYQKFIKDYLRCAAGIDDNLGKILNYLEATGLDKNTIIIYTSDQGYFLGEHGFMDKRMMLEESLRMPFVICYPKEIKGGTRNNDLILNVDFAALFADYAGIPKPSFIQGKSFRENLKGKTPANWRTAMYYRYWEHSAERPAHFGIRNKRYKLIFYYGLPLGKNGASNELTKPGWDFYDLKEDPLERHNAINDKRYQPLIIKMKKELLKLKAEAGDSDEGYPEMKKLFSAGW